MIDIRSISADLILGEDEIWYSINDQEVSYPSNGNESTFIVEDDSFWFKHRNTCIASLVKSYPPEDNGTIFDIGGGNGVVSAELAKEGFDVALVEPGRTGAFNAKGRGLKNIICATISTAKFKQKSFPAVGLFDVIEHVEDDLSFLKSIRDLMKKGGRLYVTVPSYSFLWSEEDVLAGHFRRYALRDITSMLKAAGFEIEFSSYIFRFLPVPIYLLRSLPYKIGWFTLDSKSSNISRDHAVKGGITNKILSSILQQELKNLNNKKSMRFGGSCILVARNI